MSDCGCKKTTRDKHIHIHLHRPKKTKDADEEWYVGNQNSSKWFVGRKIAGEGRGHEVHSGSSGNYIYFKSKEAAQRKAAELNSKK